MTTTGALRPPHHLVSPRARAYWATRAAIGWLVLLGAQVLSFAVSGGHPTARWIGLGVTLAAAVLHVSVMPWWRYRVHRWEATDEAVYVQFGWFNQERRIAPVSRIQTVDSKRGPIERLFHLASVTVTTASASGPLGIAGLDGEVAARLLDDLTARTQAVPGDAT
jgi:uncharacterized protein